MIPDIHKTVIVTGGSQGIGAGLVQPGTARPEGSTKKCSNKKPLASAGNFLRDRKGRVAELFAEFLGRFFLPFAHIATVDHHIMRVALSLDLNLAKFDQPCFHPFNVLLARASSQSDFASTTRARV